MYPPLAACLLASSLLLLPAHSHRTKVSTRVTGLGESVQFESLGAAKSASTIAEVVTEAHGVSGVKVPPTLVDSQPPAKTVEATHVEATHPMSHSPTTETKTPLPRHVFSPTVRHIVNEHPHIGGGIHWPMFRMSNLLIGMSFAAFIKALCIASSIMVQVSPFPQVLTWKSKQCTGQSDAAPFVAITFGGGQWCLYGAFAWIVTGNSGFLVLIQSNILGVVLGTYYLSEFYRNCGSEVCLSSLRKYLGAVSVIVLVQFCGIISLPTHNALVLTGLIASLCSFLSASAVLVTMPEVIRSKDSQSIPGAFALANLCSSIIWSICGWFLHDPMVLMPALFSVCCTTVALSCKIMYIKPDTGDKEGLEHFCLVEDGGAKMGRFLMASKMQLPADHTPIKASSL
mmetsp:Transcript_25931/g.41668  ORF Transcript_25931/g.41668 Transcript_25931/m.41668 type:complete len:399 (+) Transcript_25931:103-1299(+)